MAHPGLDPGYTSFDSLGAGLWGSKTALRSHSLRHTVQGLPGDQGRHELVTGVSGLF